MYDRPAGGAQRLEVDLPIHREFLLGWADKTSGPRRSARGSFLFLKIRLPVGSRKLETAAHGKCKLCFGGRLALS